MFQTIQNQTTEVALSEDVIYRILSFAEDPSIQAYLDENGLRDQKNYDLLTSKERVESATKSRFLEGGLS